MKLHRKSQSIDAYLDERGDLSTTRSAWYEVRDNIERGFTVLLLSFIDPNCCTFQRFKPELHSLQPSPWMSSIHLSPSEYADPSFSIPFTNIKFVQETQERT